MWGKVPQVRLAVGIVLDFGMFSWVSQGGSVLKVVMQRSFLSAGTVRMDGISKGRDCQFTA